MLTPSKSLANPDPKEPFIRSRLIKFLEEKGVKEIEGKPLEECYSFQLVKVANYWKSNSVQFLVEAI